MGCPEWELNRENCLQGAIGNRILMSNCQALKFSKFENISLIAFPISSDKSEIKELGSQVLVILKVF